MFYNSFPATVAVLLSVVFFISGAVQLAGPGFVRHAYERWDFPPRFYRVTGIIELLTAAFFAVPETRIWGVVLAALVTFTAEVILLSHRQYVWAMPGILLMVALVPAALAEPI